MRLRHFIVRMHYWYEAKGKLADAKNRVEGGRLPKGEPSGIAIELNKKQVAFITVSSHDEAMKLATIYIRGYMEATRDLKQTPDHRVDVEYQLNLDTTELVNP